MKKIISTTLVILSALLFGCATTELSDTSPEGLVKIKSKRADTVYAKPGASLANYDKVILLVPDISFRTGWLTDVNNDRLANRITNDDVADMIEEGQLMLSESFAEKLEEAGFELVDAIGSDVLAIKPAILNLDIYAPDPDGLRDTWGNTYTRGFGEATLVIELYDSVTQELLVRAYDKKSSELDDFSWRIPRNQFSNRQDAKIAFDSWAKMLVKGLESAQEAPFPTEPE